MGFKKNILITIIIGFILISIFFVITNAITKYTGFLVVDTENNFEECLEERDITLYINTEKVSETLNNFNLIQYLEYIKIKNCFRDKSSCLNEGIDSFPTLVINGNKIKGDITAEKLSEVSGCNLEK